MPEYRATYRMHVEGGAFRREVQRIRQEARELRAETESGQTDYVRNQREVASSDMHAARARRHYVGEVDRGRAALDRFNRVRQRHIRVEKETVRETDRVSRSVRRMGGDAGRAGTLFEALGGSMGRARQEGRNFASVLRLMKFPAIIAAVHTLIGAISALAAGLAALIPNLAQVTTLLAGLPGLLLGVAQGIGVAVLGFKGIGDAVKALADSQQAAAENTAAAAETQRTSARAVESAVEAVADAEENLADAHEAERDAIEDLTDARREALEALQDLRIEAERAEITEERARINLIRARRDLRELERDPDVAPTDIEYREAQLDVADAELDLKDARNQNKRTADELRESERKGIRQADIVVAARERLADATEAVSDAEEALKAAHEGVADAQREATVSAAGLTSEQEKLKEAFRAMSPEARSFARYIFSLRDRLDELRKTAQRGLLPGVQAGLERAMTLFPIVQDMVARTSAILGRFFSRLGAQLASPEWREDLSAIFRQSEFVIERAGFAFQDFLDLMRHLVIGARPVVYWLTRTVEGWIDYAENAAEAGRESGRMQEFFRDTIEVAEQLGRIIRDFSIGLFEFFRAGADVGQRLWDSIEEGAVTFREFTEGARGQNTLRLWFERAEPVIRAVVGMLGDIARAFFTVAGDARSGLLPIIAMIRDRLIPMIVELGYSVAEAFGPELIRLLANVAEGFSIIGGQGGTFVAFLRVLNLVVEGVIDLVNTVPGLRQFLGIWFILAGTVGAIRFLGFVIKATLLGNLKKVLALGGGLRTFALLMGMAPQGVGRAMFAAAAVSPKLAAGIGLVTTAIKLALGPVGWILAAITALTAAAAWLGDRFGTSAEEVHEALTKKVIPALEATRRTGETTVRGVRYTTAELAAGFVELAKVGGEAAVSNEQFGAALEDDLIPAMAKGRLSQEAWNDTVAVAEDRGYDAIAMLQAYEEQLAAQEAEQRRANAAVGAFRFVLQENSEEVRTFARVTGQSFRDFKESGIAAFRESREAGARWIRDQRDMLRDAREAYRETFDATDDVFAEFAGDTKVNSEKVLEAFEKQIDQLKDYRDNWRELRRRGAPQEFLDEIAALGLEGAALLEALADDNAGSTQRIIDKWKETGRQGKLLGDEVSDELVGTLQDLDRTIRNIPKMIALSLGLDPSKAIAKLKSFFGFLGEKNVELAPSVQGRHPRGIRTAHEGGAITGPGEGARSEVPIVAQTGEYVVSRPAVKAAGGTAALDAWHESARRKKFHRGGAVGVHTHGDMEGGVTEHLARLANLRDAMRLKVTLAADQRWAGLPAGPAAGPGRGGATGAMTALHDWITANFGVSGFLGVGHTYTGSTGFSQHAYGNAVDYFGTAAEMMRLTMTLVRMADSRAIRNLGHIIHAARAWSYNDQQFDRYTPPAGAGGDALHYRHVHIDMLPQYEGNPPGRPTPPFSYASGGYVEKDKGASVHMGEFVLQARAVKAIGLANLAALNAATGSGTPLPIASFNPGPMTWVPSPVGAPVASSPSADPGAGAAAGGGPGEPVRWSVEIDGETLVKTMQRHARTVKLTVGGRRSGSGVNRGGR